MKYLLRTATMIAFAASSAPAGSAPDPTLAADQRIVHVLNRLTFGPRPGDLEEVRRVGLENWINRQFHPEAITENPLLEAKLKPLESLRMDTASVLKEYSVNPLAKIRQVPLPELISADQLRNIQSGTAEVRQATIAALPPDLRTKVLARVAPQPLEGLPDLQKEAEEARKTVQAERQKEIRRLMPALTDLLNPDQLQTAVRGNPEQLAELFAYFDPAKRVQVAGALPPQSMAAFPEMRRLGLLQRAPQQVALGDLREGKIFRAIYSNRQLEEVLVDFWFNHFNAYEGKASVRPLLVGFERDAIGCAT